MLLRSSGGLSCAASRRIRHVTRQLTGGVRAMRSSSSSSSLSANDDEVSSGISCRVSGASASVTLNRPSKFNALNLPMVRALTPRYLDWTTSTAGSDGVKVVVMRGEGEKAFCAGGDVAAIYHEGLSGGSLPADFFYEEYQLNHLIATAHERAGVSQVAVWNGVTMGGGVGVSVHGKFRVATEKTLFAMPETGIGLFPDVGGTFALSRLQAGSAVGTYIALTGARLKAADCLWSGLATHYVDSSAVPDLCAALESMSPEQAADEAQVSAVIDGFKSEPDESKATLRGVAAEIEECFSASTAEGIMERLEQKDTEWSKSTLKTLGKMSPLSMKVTLRAVREHATTDVTIGEALQTEYRLAQRFMRQQPDSDFFEGIRAVLIEKDHSPKWAHGSVVDVSEEVVDAFFAPLEASHSRGELKLLA